MSTKKTVSFKVNGIHCNGCATKIKNSINTLNAEHETAVNISTGEVKVVFDNEKISLSDLKTKITDVGFSIEGVELE